MDNISINSIAINILESINDVFQWILSNIENIIAVAVGIVMVWLLGYCGIYGSIKMHRAQENENRQEMVRLAKTGWSCLRADFNNYDYNYNSAELLARKRCDEKFGDNRYVFHSTNFNGCVWFYAEAKQQ